LTHNVLVGLASIVVLGIAAQWVAWRLRIPSILLLLGFGILAGPLTGFLQPDQLFGRLLLPLVSLSVAVVLYEGGLSLKIRELREVGWVFFRLATVGVLLTWSISAVAARLLLGFDWPLATLLGAILVVTGPTVIGPLLRHLRLGGQVGAILKWEGIVIDPVGALLAVMVFAVVRADTLHQGSREALTDLLQTALAGGGLGLLGAVALVVPLRRYWIPDSLQNPVSLATALAVFTLANLLQEESGLVAVTVMGVGLANQRLVGIRHLVEFKENLTVLLISGLFILLSARLRPEELRGLDLGSFLFLLTLIVVARPVTVLVSTLGSKLTWKERLFLSAMAPRGIVAAAVSSVFALEMVGAGYQQAERMLPVTFLVIIGTVSLYGLGAALLAWRLGLARPNPQGVLIVGAHRWARELAEALQTEGHAVLLADSDWSNLSVARLAGLPTYYGSILGEHALTEIDYGKLGRLVAVTSNDEVNSLACLRFIEVFGRREVYQLPFAAAIEGRREAVSLEQRGRLLFGLGQTFAHLQERFGDNPMVRTTRLTKEFDYEAFRRLHGDAVVPVCLLKENNEIEFFTLDTPLTPLPEQTVLSLGLRTVEPEGAEK
jgi:NhaP-type Na+/H+ or K+/H+ antiporter